MSKVCDICNKGAVSGGSIVHRGLAKKSGGIGLQLVKTNKRQFKPNLQSLNIRVNGKKTKAKVCTACIRSNKIEKA